MPAYQYALRLPPELAEQVSQLSRLHHQSFNSEIVEAAQAWVVQHEPQLRALAEEAVRLKEATLDPSIQKYIQDAQERAEEFSTEMTRCLSDPAIKRTLELLRDPSIQANIKHAQDVMEQLRRARLI